MAGVSADAGGVSVDVGGAKDDVEALGLNCSTEIPLKVEAVGKKNETKKTNILLTCSLTINVDPCSRAEEVKAHQASLLLCGQPVWRSNDTLEDDIYLCNMIKSIL